MSDTLRQHFWWLVIFALMAFFVGSEMTWPWSLAAVPLAGVATWALARTDPERQR